MTVEFKAWPKIPRIENKKEYYTEKLDGTNACIIITEDGDFACQSRSRLITPEDDNYGFAAWAYENKNELLKLEPGHHFGFDPLSFPDKFVHILLDLSTTLGW